MKSEPALLLHRPERLLAVLLSFASGALITALAFELFEESYGKAGLWRAGLGMLVGAVLSVALSTGLTGGRALVSPNRGWFR